MVEVAADIWRNIMEGTSLQERIFEIGSVNSLAKGKYFERKIIARGKVILGDKYQHYLQ